MNRKTILVTGSSRGIGKAIAIKYAKKGYNVIINCLKNEELLANVKKEIEATLAAKKSEQMIMSLMPAGIILYLQLASPGFLDILYGNPFGICAMTVCLTVYGAAYWMGKRIVEIEV